MDIDEAAAALDGNSYGSEGSSELFAEMKASGLVAAFGASDDLIEFRGAINDEEGAYGGAKIKLTRTGLLTSECDCDDCPYFARLAKDAAIVLAKWGAEGFSWFITAEFPHATFAINEGGRGYCRGIVFALADVEA